MNSASKHVFVAGPSRSGTALTRSVLNAHPDVFLAGETHWFDDLRTTLDKPDAQLDARARGPVEDHFLALTHRPFGHGGDPEEGWLDRQELRRRAEALGGSGDAYFDAFLQMVAEENGGAEIQGEKTPRHIFRVDDIIAAYPEAKFILMIRDPRAIVASYKDWNSKDGRAAAPESQRTERTFDPVLLTLLWRAQARAGIRAEDSHQGSVMVQRYEDLVLDPEDSVRRIAAFVGVDFGAEMLEVPLHNSSYSGTQWEAGISSAPLERWKERLEPAEVKVVEAVAGREMRRHGYDRLDPVVSKVAVGKIILKSPYRSARAAITNRGRMGNKLSYLKQRLRPLAGR